MKQKHRLFCPYCGTKITKRQEEDSWRDYCIPCGLFFYDNPLPVVSTILVSDRSILLVKRGKKPYRGQWCLPTGFAETGEDIEEAALRELGEETGIHGRILSLVDVDSCSNYFYGDLLFLTYEAEIVEGLPTAGDDAVGVKFFPIMKLPRLAFSSNTRAVNAYLKEKAEQWAIADSFSLAVGYRRPPAEQKNLLSDHLIKVIENNSSEIIQRWISDVLTRSSTVGYRQLNQTWMVKGVRKILSHFSKWLGGFYDDDDIQKFYVRLGRGSKAEGLLLTEVLSSWSLLREHTWKYALASGVWVKTIDIYAALELDQRIIIFFDKAAFYTAQGYED